MEENKLEGKATVSILMATYNGGKYLKEQLDSIINQSNANVKILVRDDGSKDDTINILDEYQNKGLLTWYTGGHLGVQKGYLDLLKHAPKAEYYAFSDQDDVWESNKLKTAVGRLSGMPKDKPALYYCGQKLVDMNLNFISEHKISINRSPQTNYLISNVAGCTAVFNQTLVDIVNSAEPSFILMHDSWIFKVCLAMGGAYYADNNTYIKYRQHGGNVAGLDGGLKGKIHQAKRYIKEFKIQKQMKNLMSCYGDRMTPEYRKITQTICNYDKSITNTVRLGFSRQYDFKSLSLNIIVRMKILLRKL